MFRPWLLSSALAALISGPALADITVTSIGTASSAAGSTTLAITTTAACGAGSMVAVAGADIANTAVNTTADDVGNNYSATTALTLSGNLARMKQFFTKPSSTIPLPSGHTITVTYNATTGIKLATAVCIVGLSTAGGLADQQTNAGATGTSTAPSFSGAALLSNNEIIIGVVVLPTGAAATYTEASGYTSIANVTNVAGMWWAYKLSTDTSAPTYAPTISPSQVWGDNLMSFYRTTTTRIMLGVGQ